MKFNTKKNAENLNEFDGKLLEKVGVMMLLHVLVFAKKKSGEHILQVGAHFLDTPEELQ